MPDALDNQHVLAGHPASLDADASSVELQAPGIQGRLTGPMSAEHLPRGCIDYFVDCSASSHVTQCYGRGGFTARGAAHRAVAAMSTNVGSLWKDRSDWS